MKLIVTHNNADFDAIASMVAARFLFPDALPVLPFRVNPNVTEFLSLHKDLFDLRQWKEIDCDKVSGLVVVDTSRWSRLSVPKKLKGRNDLNITLFDHHPENSDIEADNTCNERVGAAITLLLRKMKDFNFTPMHATLFLAGLYEDTGSLSFQSTTPEDIYTGAFLLERKADLAIAGYVLHHAYNQKQQEILSEMLAKAVYDKINGHSVAFSKIRLDSYVDSLAVIVQMFREITGIEAAFGIFKNNEDSACIVISRSIGEQLNVGAIMRDIGGGGHQGAGSALVKRKTMDDTENLIRELLNSDQPFTVQIGDLMSFPVFTVRDDETIENAGKLLGEKGCTGLPVVDSSGQLVGIISRRDINRRVKKDSQLKSPVKAFMSKKVIATRPGVSPMDATRKMVEYDIGRLPVVDDGSIIGIVTRSDMMHYWYNLDLE